MTNEETLELLKPIMLDGTEKIGDKVFSILLGELTITDISNSGVYVILCGDVTFTKDGFWRKKEDVLPTLFKTNPFEYLSKLNNNQERVIEVKTRNGLYIPKVCIKVLDGYAVCWQSGNSLDNIDPSVGSCTFPPANWREVQQPQPKSITKEEALKILAEKGVDTTNLTIE